MDRVYLDTSVFGGCFDVEFMDDSLRFFQFVNRNLICILISPILLKELDKAPKKVKEILINIPKENIEYIDLTDEAIKLRNSYIENGIVSKKWIDDATHVALATINNADAIISWNFRHIVRLDKIKLFNQVNTKNGYGILPILSPKEVYYE